LLQKLDIGVEFLGGSAFALRSQDQTKAGGENGVSNLSNPLSLTSIFDLSTHANVTAFGHEHDIAAWQSDSRGHTRSLRAARALGDLNHELLPRLQKVLDFTTAKFAALDTRRAVIPGPRVLGQNVGDVQEGVPLKANVDEGRVHTRQDILDNSLENGANNALFALNTVLLQLPFL
jgi:hypothetical protein